MYHERIFNECFSRRETWDVIGKVCKLQTVNKNVEHISIENHKIPIDDGDVAEEFVRHFATIANKLADRIETQIDDSPNCIEHNQNKHPK